MSSPRGRPNGPTMRAMTTPTLDTWTPCDTGTHNLGNATPEQVVALMAEGLAVLNLQEASDRPDVIAALEAAGYRVIRLTLKGGQAATPMAYDPTQVRLMNVRAVLLHRAGNIGPGTGPDHGKAKWLIIARFHHIASGRTLIVANVHLYAGQGRRNRRRLAFGMLRTTVALLRYLAVVLLNGDLNTDADSPVTRVLRAAGFTCNHDTGPRLPTHGRRWRPDQSWCLDRWSIRPRVRIISHRTVRTRSDHRALIVSRQMRMTARKRRAAHGPAAR